METFAALKLHIDSWRWRGVPIYIRAGKCLAVTCTEILVRLRQPPTMYKHFTLASNYVRMRISPDIVLGFGLNVTSPVQESHSELSELLASRHPCAKEMDAYERVLSDAMAGDSTLFAREDYVEEAWRIVDPALKAGTPVYEYDQKTWDQLRSSESHLQAGGKIQPSTMAQPLEKASWIITPNEGMELLSAGLRPRGVILIKQLT